MDSFEEKSLGPSRAEKDAAEARSNGKSIDDSAAAREDGRADGNGDLDPVAGGIEEKSPLGEKVPQEEKAASPEKAPGLDAVASEAVSALLGDDRVQGVLYDAKLALAALRQSQSTTKEDQAQNALAYQECIRRIREVVRRVVPTGATMIVTSKGDEELLDLYGRQAWHFPQALDGTYSGSYPTDGTAVIAHLEALRARGGDYLIFPAPALWWLDSYPKFALHLEQNYPVIFREEATCVIFRLQKLGDIDAGAWRPRLARLMSDYRERFESEPAILDWDTGVELKDAFPGETVFSPAIPLDTLPYADHSIPIVALSSAAPTIQAEAKRVASHAVVTLTSLDEMEGIPDPGISTAEGVIDISHVSEEAGASLPSTSIVIPTFNGGDQLKLCLRALEETLPEPFHGEVIVVDDGSREETQALLRAWPKSRLRLQVLRNRTNSGFVESCNRGARAATGDILVFLNDDTLPQAGWLSALLRIFHAHPDAGAVGGMLLYPDGRLQEAGNVIFSDGSGANFGRGEYHVDDPLYNYVREVDYCSAALLATPRALFTELGGFDERYRPGYYEDTDYCFALRQHGRRVYYQPASVVVHSEGATGGTDLSAGAKRYQAVNRVKFVQKWREILQSQPSPPRRFDVRTWHELAVRDGQASSAQTEARRALVCAPLLPEFDRESGSRRVFHLIEFLREAGCAVSFVSENPLDGDGRYVRLLHERQVAVYRGFGPQTTELFRLGGFDIAIFAFWHLAEAHMDELRRVSPETRIIVDAIDLHWLRDARHHFLNTLDGSSKGLDSRFARKMVGELNTYAAADAVLTVSDKEAQTINDLLGDRACAHTVPDYEDARTSTVPFSERRGMVFIGNFRHEPNLDAAAFLCEEIVPRLDPALLAEHPVYIVGNEPPEDVLAYGREMEFVHVVGWVPSLLPYLQNARVSLVPVRYGAGTKRKLLLAIMAGTPVVSTSMGVEGLGLSHGRHVLVADDAARFAKQTQKLVSDSKTWERLVRQGADRVASVHGREAVRARFRDAIASTVERQPAGIEVRAEQADRIREVLPECVPAGASVLVISDGDPDLLDLPGRDARHFPVGSDGRHKEADPRDGKEAIEWLEKQRAKGGHYLLIPPTGFWWLKRYDEFAEHLGDRYKRVWADDACIVYRLRRHKKSKPKKTPKKPKEARKERSEPREERS
jgi:GT2 family glycosyltransferase